MLDICMAHVLWHSIHFCFVASICLFFILFIYLLFCINERTISEAKHGTSSVSKIGRSTPQVDLPVTGNFRILLYELFLADQVSDLHPSN